MCRHSSVSCWNGVGFTLLLIAGITTVITYVAPYWIRYEWRRGIPILVRQAMSRRPPTYPFEYAYVRGLWAICTIDDCRWFVADDAVAEKSLPGWYVAIQCMFGIAIGLYTAAFILESIHACCKYCILKSYVPAIIGSLTVAAALLTGISVALFGGFSYKEKELDPQSIHGQDGQFEWTFYLAIASSVIGILAALMFYIDSCRKASIYRGYDRPSVEKA